MGILISIQGGALGRLEHLASNSSWRCDGKAGGISSINRSAALARELCYDIFVYRYL